MKGVFLFFKLGISLDDRSYGLCIFSSQQLELRSVGNKKFLFREQISNDVATIKDLDIIVDHEYFEI